MIQVKGKYIKDVVFEIFETDDIKTKKYKNIEHDGMGTIKEKIKINSLKLL